MTNETDLFIKSKQLWGIPSQLNMMAEESSELTTAALHLNRANKDKRKAWENFAEEIADVEFMIAEFKFLFPGLVAKVDDYRVKKAMRLFALINAEEKAGGKTH